MTRLSGAILVLALCLLGTPGRAAASSPIGAFCGTAMQRHPRTYAHVIWIWLENHSYEDVIGSTAAPFINALATNCGLATNFHNITHVSLPNYVGAVTGLPLASLQPFLLDCSPGGACLTGAPSLFAQVPSWKAYMESMTSNCQASGFVGYAVRHNPPPYLTSLSSTCGTFDVPYTSLQADLDNDTLPSFAFITPNTVNDMHDGADPGAIQHGDAWLATELPKIVASPAYQSGNTAVFVTWDEGESGSDFAIGEDCVNNVSGGSCHIATIVVSPYTPHGTTSNRFFSHYALLKTTEQLLGIKGKSKYLGLARRAHSMRHPFRL